MAGTGGVLSATIAAGCYAPPGSGLAPGTPGSHTGHGTVPPAQPSGSAGGAGPERHYELVAQWIDAELDGTPVKLRSYNGQVPGPLLETQGGETLRIRVRNDLTPYDSSGWNGDHNVRPAIL